MGPNYDKDCRLTAGYGRMTSKMDRFITASLHKLRSISGSKREKTGACPSHFLEHKLGAALRIQAAH
jgi:hypothetical protein